MSSFQRLYDKHKKRNQSSDSSSANSQNKSQSKDTSSTSSKSSNGSSSFQRLYNKHRESTGGRISNYQPTESSRKAHETNNSISEAYDLANEVRHYFAETGSMYGYNSLQTSMKRGMSYKKRIEKARAKLDEIANEFGSSMSADNKKALDDLKSQLDYFDTNLAEVPKYWSQFKNEQEYQSGIKQNRYKEKYKDADYDTVQQAINELESAAKGPSNKNRKVEEEEKNFGQAMGMASLVLGSNYNKFIEDTNKALRGKKEKLSPEEEYGNDAYNELQYLKNLAPTLRTTDIVNQEIEEKENELYSKPYNQYDMSDTSEAANEKRAMFRQELAAAKDRINADRTMSEAEKKQAIADAESELQKRYGEYGTAARKLMPELENLKSERYILEGKDILNGLEQNTDFAEKSKITADMPGWLKGVKESVGDYAYSGGDLTGYALQLGQDTYAGNLALFELTDDERAKLRYMWNTQGEQAVKDYVDKYLRYDINQRFDTQANELFSEWAKDNPVGMSALSVATNLGSGMAYLDTAAQKLGNTINGEPERPVDWNRPVSTGTYGFTTSTRDTVANDVLGGGVNGFLYQTVMSMADSGAIMAMTAGAGLMGAGAEQAFSAGGRFAVNTAFTSMLGGAAAESAARTAKDAGATDNQALTIGLLEGAAETIFEEVSLGNIQAIAGNTSGVTLRKFFENILKQGMVEGSEEVFTTLANTLSEAVILGDKSTYNQNLQQYLAQGYSQEEADKMASRDWWNQLFQDFLGGAISGGLFGAGGSFVARINYNRSGKNILAKESGDAFVDSVVENISDKNSEAYKYAEDLQANPDKITKGTLGTLQGLVDDYAQTSDAAKEEAAQTRQTLSSANVMDRMVQGIRDERAAQTQALAQENNEATIEQTAERAANIESGKEQAVEVPKQKIATNKTAQANAEKTHGMTVTRDGKQEQVNSRIQVTNTDTFASPFNSAVDGSITLKLDDGTEVNSDEVEFADKNTQTIIDEAKKFAAQGWTADQVQSFIDNYDGKMNPTAYANAFGYAALRASADESGRKWESNALSIMANVLTGDQARAAYTVGLQLHDQAAADMAAEKKAAIKKVAKQVSKDINNSTAVANAEQEMINKKAKGSKGIREPGFVYEGEVTDKNRDTIDTLRQVSKALGINIVVVDKLTGKFKLKDANGKDILKDGEPVYKKVEGNGKYSRIEGTVYLSLDADRPLRVVLAHELTHFIQQYSPQLYEELKSYIREYMNRDGSNAFENQVNKYMEQYGYERPTAIDEVVADACDMFLDASRFKQEMANELASKNRKLAEKIRDFIEKLLKSLNAFFTDQSGKFTQSDTSALLADTVSQKDLNKLRKMWDVALSSATKTYSKVSSEEIAAIHKEAQSQVGKSTPFDINEYFSVQPRGARSAAPGQGQDVQDFIDGLSTEERKTYKLFADVQEASKVGDLHIAAVALQKGALDWNAMLDADPEWAAAAKRIAEVIPKDIRENMRMDENGRLEETLFEKTFKLHTSLAQRLVDALPFEMIDPNYEVDGKKVKLVTAGANQAVGGEAYRRALVRFTRELFKSGVLKSTTLSNLAKDDWGTLGFLTPSEKTIATGDFSTLCPQVYFNKGCFYCYRRAQLEKGFDNKQAGQSIWYTGDILRLTDKMINQLNLTGGLRIQSSGDWMPHFSTQLADLICDAEMRGLQVKIVTKEPSLIEYIASLKAQGLGKNVFLNISADYVVEKAGKTEEAFLGSNSARPYMTDDNGELWWKRALSVEEANKFREKYDWVAVRIVAMNTEQLIRALKDPRIDVVTAFHGQMKESPKYIDTVNGEFVSDVDPVGNAGMPVFAKDKNGNWYLTDEWDLLKPNGKVEVKKSAKTQVQKDAAQRILDEGLVEAYHHKTCCIYGRCDQCQVLCGKANNTFENKNATNRDEESITYWEEHMDAEAEYDYMQGEALVGEDDTVVYSQKSEEGESIRKQIFAHLDELNDMPSAGSVDVNVFIGMGKEQIKQAIRKRFGDNFTIDKENYGRVVFGKNQINKGVEHLRVIERPQDAAVMLLIPKIVKQGIKIGEEHINGRHSITFGAPVIITDGGKTTRVNVGVVVLETRKNYYHAHRMSLANGGAVQLSKIKAASRPAVASNDANSPKETASTNKIAQSDSKSQEQFSLKDSTGRTLSKGQQKYFADSKVVDKDGNLIPMYHGTKAEFTKFMREYIGSTGRFEGSGFNFTPARSRAASYGGRVMEGYVNITSPLSSTEKTISLNMLADIIAESDPTGDNFIADYARETRDYGTETFVRREAMTAARVIWENSDNDVDIYSYVSASHADSERLIAIFERMGYDGLIHYNDNGTIKTVVTFNSNQFKNIDNLNPTEDEDVRYSLKETDDTYMAAVNKGDMETAQRIIDEVARKAGYHVARMYHGSLDTTFYVFDRTHAYPESNSGAGFYFTTNRKDADVNYANAEGPDPGAKIERLANWVYDDEWEGMHADTYEEAEKLVTKFLSKKPGIYEVYLKYDNPYVRDWTNGSTNIYNQLKKEYDGVKDSGIYEDLVDYIYNRISQVVGNAYRDLEDNYDFVRIDSRLDAPIQSLIADLAACAIDYNLLTWGDIEELIDNQMFVDLDADSGSAEFTRAIIENFGYDAIVDQEVSRKFKGILQDIDDSNGTQHVTVFRPNQIKLADPVTYDKNGNIIPPSQRFNEEEDDIRYSLKDGTVETAISVPDGTDANGNPVDFIGLMLDRIKKGETRDYPSMAKKMISQNKWEGLAKNKLVYGRVRFGKPIEITKESPEYKDAMIEGTNFDIKDGGTKWYYPVLEVEDFRDNPIPTIQGHNSPVYAQFSLKDEPSMTRYKSTAILKESTIDSYLEDYGASNPDYAQAYLVYMSPDAFLNLSSTDMFRRELEKEAGPLDEERFARATSFHPIRLWIDTNGKTSGNVRATVIDHEGRHRMIALRNAGITSVPVALIDTRTKYTKKKLDRITLRRQFFMKEAYEGLREYDLELIKEHLPTETITGNIIPVSTGNRDALIEEFTKDREPDIDEVSLQYSLKDTDSMSNREILAGAYEVVAQTDKEKEVLERYRESVEKLDGIQAKLDEARKEIHTIMFTKGGRAQMGDRLAELQDNVKKWEKQLTLWDGKLIRLQASKPIRDIVTRARANEARQTAAKYRERIAGVRDSNAVKDVKRKLQKLYNDLKKRALHPTEGKYIPAPLMKTMLEVLEAIDYRGGREDTKIHEKLEAMYRQYGKLKNDKDTLNQTVYDEELSKMLDELVDAVGDKYVREMSRQEITEVYRILRAISYTLNQKVKQIGRATAISVYEAGERAIEEVNNAKGPLSRATHVYNMGALSPMRFFRMISGWARDSVLQDQARQLNEGQRKMNEILMQGFGLFQEFLETRADQREFEAFHGKGKGNWIQLKDANGKAMLDENGKEVYITHDMLVALYLHSLNEDNLRHVISGGIRIPDLNAYVKGKGSSAYTKGDFHQKVMLTEDMLQKLFKEELTTYDMKYAQVVYDFFNTFSKQVINETSMALNGYKKAEVDNYFPIHVDDKFLGAQFDSIIMDGSLEGMGILKQRVKSSKPIYLEGASDAVIRNLNSVAKYGGLAIPIKNFTRIYNVNTVRTNELGEVIETNADSVANALSKKYKGDDALKYIEMMLKDLQQTREIREGGFVGAASKFLTQARGKFAQATLAMNLSVTLKQAASYPTAAAELGWAPLAKALMTTEKMDLDTLAKYTPIMWIRSHGFVDTELGDAINQQDWSSRVKGIMGWIQKMDIATVTKLAKATEFYIRQTQPSLKVGSDEYWKAVAAKFNDVVEKTQPNYTAMQRPEVLRTQNALIRAMTMFMTQRLQNYNILFDAVGEYRAAKDSGDTAWIKKAGLNLRRAVTSQAVAAAVIAAMTMAVSMLTHRMKRYRDDDDEITAESFMGAFFGDMLSTVAGSFLGGSEVYEIINNFTNGTTYDVLDAPNITMVNDVIAAFEEFGKIAADIDKKRQEAEENGELYEGDADAEKILLQLKEVGTTIAKFMGVPVENAEKLAMGVYYYALDAANGTLWESDIERSKTDYYNQMVKAIQEGDMDRYNKLHEKAMELVMQDSKYEGENAKTDAENTIQKGIKMVLAKNDERVRQAAEAMLASDTTTAGNLRKEMIAEGYSESAVVGAINYMIGKLKDDDETPVDDTVEDWEPKVYTSADIQRAYENGSQEALDDIKDYFMEQGLTEAEAQKKVDDEARKVVRVGLYDAVESGDITNAKRFIADLKRFGQEDEWAIVTMLSKKYKKIWQEYYMRGDTASMKALENALYGLELHNKEGNRHYTQGTFDAWKRDYQKGKK